MSLLNDYGKVSELDWGSAGEPVKAKAPNLQLTRDACTSTVCIAAEEIPELLLLLARGGPLPLPHARYLPLHLVRKGCIHLRNPPATRTRHAFGAAAPGRHNPTQRLQWCTPYTLKPWKQVPAATAA